MSKQPVILLAFANDKEGAFLRNISEEQDAINNALDKAEQAELCKVVIISNATVNKIINRFNTYEDQVRIFHYGGHADEDELILKHAQDERVKAGNLQDFLHTQRNLKVVFLNGCNTEEQAKGLLKGPIEHVIVTDRAIEDKAARYFAEAFYQKIGNKNPVREAFKEAQAEVNLRLDKGDTYRGFYFGKNDPNQPVNETLPPWHIFSSPEADNEWDLGKTEKSVIKKKLEGLIGRGRLEQVLEELVKYSQDTDPGLHEEVLQHQATFETWAREDRMGILSFSESDLQKKRIQHALIKVVSNL